MIEAKFKMSDDSHEALESMGIKTDAHELNKVYIKEESIGAFFLYGDEDEKYMEIFIHGCSFPVIYDDEVYAKLCKVVGKEWNIL